MVANCDKLSNSKESIPRHIHGLSATNCRLIEWSMTKSTSVTIDQPNSQ
jgi:hypothetical protein